MSEKMVGSVVNTQFLKSARQEIVDKLHELQPRQWRIGVEIKNRRGEGPSLFFVRKTAAQVTVHVGSSGAEIAKVKLNPDRNDGLRSSYNYDQMEALVEKLMEHPEAAAILRQL